MNELIKDAIRRANKLGAKGIQVVGYIESQSATESPDLKLIMQLPPLETASGVAWYE